MWGLELWQEILLYIVVFIDLYIFVKLSQIKIMGRSLIKLHWRIFIAVIFPLIFVVAVIFGAFLIALILTVLFILFLFSLFRRKKYKFNLRFF